ncbi:helix-turn-helix transcriptional regulator [Iamia sp. SCSIO 61187]|uniref:winged helix-turn-helix transcriptional regulator n=1 Tax=Iamia sp. SCSIO 61187 TaxID=2722752 RepID=UPI001C62B6F2|nr:helix-turn-helix domain-containing protein [Iamia sp. SCSIO 61187]QYG91020.1 helix-turn-helix transcriptional regulator [Iamia sp. SCSIO 61187]
MKRTPFGDWPCSVARTVDILGDWWTPLVLREAYLGTRRFDVFQRNLGIGRNILTQRLNRLVDEGVLARRPYQERPLRHEYVLTDKGRDLFGVIAAMKTWGDRWLAGDDGPPLTYHHTPCDHDMDAEVVCSHCRQRLDVRQVRAHPGPGGPAPAEPTATSAG